MVYDSASREGYPGFRRFAGTVRDFFIEDPEGFWAISTGKFLDYFAAPRAFLGRSRRAAAMIKAFAEVKRDIARFLAEVDKAYGCEVRASKGYRPQYMQDALAVFALLAAWLADQGGEELLEDFDRILAAGVLAVAGYCLLDSTLDSEATAPVEVLTANILLAEYEALALDVFGAAPATRGAFHRVQSLFLASELKEKRARWKSCPYEEAEPKGMGTKGLNATSPLILSLAKLGKEELVPDYIEFFLLLGAPIQMIDDWTDLEDDLAIGHYSYMAMLHAKGGSLRDSAAAPIRGDREAVRRTLEICEESLAAADAIMERLGDEVMLRLSRTIGTRTRDFYRKEFGLS